jgi:fructose-bisphosphate aldolase class I
VFGELSAHRVVLEQMLLKTGMVLPGSTCAAAVDAGEVATATLRTLRRTVPAAVPGIVFLSGGQSDTDATERLNAIAQAPAAPWRLSFSYGRALQTPALRVWRGEPRNVSAAQAALRFRARCNGAAVLGHYSQELEAGGAPDAFPSSR